IARDKFLRWIDQHRDSLLLWLENSQMVEKLEDEEDGGDFYAGHANTAQKTAQANHPQTLGASLIFLAYYLQFLSTRPTDHDQLPLGCPSRPPLRRYAPWSSRRTTLLAIHSQIHFQNTHPCLSSDYANTTSLRRSS
ncbi:hypothetical protein PCASD_24237, partial [Puccinia coronata f. sp. avenae]